VAELDGPLNAPAIAPLKNEFERPRRRNMDLIADRGRRVSVDELNTSQLLRHARKQAHQRNLDDMVIVDVDAHHYENENYGEFLPYMESDVFRQLIISSRSKNRASIMPTQVGYQDMGGRVTRYPMRSTEKTEGGGVLRDVQLGHRWMDAMSVDYSCLFPTGMLNIGLHPQKEMEFELCWAYNRWLTEKVLPESQGRFYSMLSLPFNDADGALRQVETFGDRKHVGGFMVTTVRSHMGVHDNAYMKVYRAIEERGLVLSFHSGPNWGEPIFKSCNRFLSVHALGFTWYNVLHLTNWVINGMGERFPKLPIIWIESGLAWVPFLMQRLDHEYMLRPSECPLLKKKPSDYMRDMYYSSQPMEIQDMGALECTFRMINAETQLLYSSDYPHWDFDLPSTIYDLPFVSEKGKHNILGGTASRLFKLPPRNEKQKENLKKFGNLSAAA
jgi:predicted TIM-barrel fold metal-dependent hydrolase